ncbi:MAG TPA: hypothetical protein VNL98_02510 [Gemmatimonadales bacterium]|nr:hypothetical protein [Gemmatimonadales bacterium]
MDTAPQRVPTLAIVEELTRRYPRLLPARDLVELVCADPWLVRRPRDLAARAGLDLRELRGRVRELEFRRVEHFILFVRLALREYLVTTRRVRPHTAHLLVGISDLSNLRRQVRRASPRSRPLCEVPLQVAS